MSTELAGRILSFLDVNHVISLATTGPDGPHATNLFYARDGYWSCTPAELKEAVQDVGVMAANVEVQLTAKGHAPRLSLDSTSNRETRHGRDYANARATDDAPR